MHSVRTVSRFNPSITPTCMMGLYRHVIIGLFPLQSACDSIRSLRSVITTHASVLAHEEAFLLVLSC
jgi:hypothetical protein